MAGRLLSTNDLGDYEEIFRNQIEDTKEKMTYYQNRLDSLKGWYDLLCEGRRVRIIGPDNMTLKHVPTRTYMCMRCPPIIWDPFPGSVRPMSGR